ncbi:serine hydrolase [Sphingomonas sp.]|uniref:serine hydrolase n=1 Tax=Sphingomonas sp. TaxID=28214 RepID=UPI0025F5D816|nr:serine hydrolase [Sphingomonas sp.]
MSPILRPASRRRFMRDTALLILATMPMPALGQDTQVDPAVGVDRYLGAQMSKLRIPGLAMAVVKGGKIVLSRSYGIGSVEFGLPARDDTVFAINSITKAFTGVAAMRLVDEGKLDLAAPVGRYLTDLPETWRAVTIRQLLSHQSGLPDVMRAPTVETDAAAAWKWVQQQPVRFPPGARFDYCQTNYTLIQRVLNTLEGQALDAPLAEEQLRLLGMAHTYYGDAYDMIPNRVPTYRWSLPGPFVNGYSGAAPDAPRTLKEASERFLPFRRASSGLNSTAIDMANWLIAVSQGSLLTTGARETMWTPVSFTNGTTGQWGMGWEVFSRGSHRAVGMTGGGRAAVFYYPEDHVGVVILTNLAGSFPEDMVDKIASLYAPDLPLAGVPALRIALEEQGYDHAATAAATIKARNPDLVWPESELNDWGYRLLSTGRARDAVPLFAFIAHEYPNSANAHDSLAQAYHVVGDAAASLREYRRVLELDPSNESAKRHVAELAEK